MDSHGGSQNPGPHDPSGKMVADQMLVWVWIVIAVMTLVYFIRRRNARLESGSVSQRPRTGLWSTGLFGGWNTLLPHWRSCLPSCLFPAAQVALNTADLERRPPEVADLCANCLWGTQLGAYRNRRVLRDQLDLPVEPCEDLVAVMCCPCCAIAQHTRELDLRGASNGGSVAFRPQDPDMANQAQYTVLQETTPPHRPPTAAPKGEELL
eukprot:RCo019667